MRQECLTSRLHPPPHIVFGMKTLGQRIVEAREKADMEGPGALAAALSKLGPKHKVTREAVWQWEKDETTPKAFRIPAIAKVTGVTEDVFWNAISQKSTPVKPSDTKSGNTPVTPVHQDEHEGRSKGEPMIHDTHAMQLVRRLPRLTNDDLEVLYDSIADEMERRVKKGPIEGTEVG